MDTPFHFKDRLPPTDVYLFFSKPQPGEFDQSQHTSSSRACTAPHLVAALTTCVCTADSRAFATAMLGVFAGITCYAELNFQRTHLPVRTNLNLSEWAAICTTEEDALTFDYLTFGFPAGYEGPVATSTFHNHLRAVHHSKDVAAYIMKELGEGVMLGPFDTPPLSLLGCKQTSLAPRKTPLYAGLSWTCPGLFLPQTSAINVP